MGVPSVGASGAIFGTLAVRLGAVRRGQGCLPVTGHMGRSLRTLAASLPTRTKGTSVLSQVHVYEIDLGVVILDATRTYSWYCYRLYPL